MSRAVQGDPDNAKYLANLAYVLTLVGRQEDAVACCRRALERRPHLAAAHHHLAIAEAVRGRLDRALASIETAVRHAPTCAEIRVCRAICWLQAGQFAKGWREYEWRWRTVAVPPRTLRKPRWDGSPLRGRTLLVHAEQGFGDTLQFFRYGVLAQRCGGRVLLEVQPSLVPVLRSGHGFDRLLPRGVRLPRYDVHAALMSLPGLLGTSLKTIPAEIPYLSADDGLVQRWRRELGAVNGLKVGIAWQGSDRLRSIPLADFAPLAAVPGARLYCLQQGPGRRQLGAAPFPVIDLGPRLDRTHGAFVDTAAVMQSLDLVVTSDTSIGHLAGALGVPVWVALPVGADWRWLRDREDSPWYPTMRLFRQRSLRDWRPVFERMASELRAGVR